jgi:hypothetical protein
LLLHRRWLSEKTGRSVEFFIEIIKVFHIPHNKVQVPQTHEISHFLSSENDHFLRQFTGIGERKNKRVSSNYTAILKNFLDFRARALKTESALSSVVLEAPLGLFLKKKPLFFRQHKFRVEIRMISTQNIKEKKARRFCLQELVISSKIS